MYFLWFDFYWQIVASRYFTSSNRLEDVTKKDETTRRLFCQNLWFLVHAVSKTQHESSLSIQCSCASSQHRTLFLSYRDASVTSRSSPCSTHLSVHGLFRQFTVESFHLLSLVINSIFFNAVFSLTSRFELHSSTRCPLSVGETCDVLFLVTS